MNNLTPKLAQELGGALARLHELGETKIITKENEVEKQSLERFVATTCTAHAGDLLGAWFTVRQQYEPLLLSISQIVRTVGGIIARQDAVIEAQAKQEKQ